MSVSLGFLSKMFIWRLQEKELHIMDTLQEVPRKLILKFTDKKKVYRRRAKGESQASLNRSLEILGDINVLFVGLEQPVNLTVIAAPTQ